MKLLALFLAVSILPGLAHGVTLSCEVPAAAGSLASAICEDYRLERQIRSSEWDNDTCATELLRVGLIEVQRRLAKRQAQQTTRTIVNDAVTAYKAVHPTSVTPVQCGDGTRDPEFGEQCDDGGRVPGDGCDADCQTE